LPGSVQPRDVRGRHVHPKASTTPPERRPNRAEPLGGQAPQLPAATESPADQRAPATRRSHRTRRARLRYLLTAGVVDSTGLALGWTVFLLAVTEHDGVKAAALQASAMLVGVALSAPFSAWIAPLVSPRTLLRALALAEGACRLALVVLFLANVHPWLLALVVAVMNVLAWSGFAAMRSETARAEGTGSGRSLTRYAVAVAASEAVAAAAASLLVGGRPTTPVVIATAAVYAGTLLPQWLAAREASRVPPGGVARLTALRDTLPISGLGALVFLVAGGPALVATVLAYELYGTRGVIASALSFAIGSAAAPRVQAVVDRWAHASVASFSLAAVLVAGWAFAGWNLIGLLVAQACAGAAQCSLEGDLDARIVARVRAGHETTALALGSASRALGGALAVGLLPTVLERVAMPLFAGLSALAMLVGAIGCAVVSAMRRW